MHIFHAFLINMLKCISNYISKYMKLYKLDNIAVVVGWK